MEERENAASPRLPWLDLAKLVGIVIVLYAHLSDRSTLAYVVATWFAMPLFFFCRGMVYRSALAGRQLVRQEARRLLLPYISFLVALIAVVALWRSAKAGSLSEVPRFLEDNLLGFVFGGRRLEKEFVAFWFPTSLFLTLMAFACVERIAGGRRAWILAALAGSYAIAVFSAWEGASVALPLAADTVFYALPFLGLGYLLREWALQPPRFAFVLSFAIILCGVAVELRRGPLLEFDLREGDYGVPIVEPILAFAGILGVFGFCRWATRMAWVRAAALRFAPATLTIMFTHYAIDTVVQKAWPGAALAPRMGIAFALSYGVYRAIQSSPLARRWFLGASEGPQSLPRTARK